MFGRRRRQAGPVEPEPSGAGRGSTKSDRVGSAMFYVLGPATVQGALQGHDPRVRQAWKDLVARNKQAREDARRRRDADEAGAGGIADSDAPDSHA